MMTDMSEFLFGTHNGHLNVKADRIARRHGAVHVNYTEPGGRKRGWFAAPNRGNPFDAELAARINAEIEAAGGIEALTRK